MPEIVGEEAFFGDLSRFVKSDVLMRAARLQRLSPDGVMCFGSRDPTVLRPGTGDRVAVLLLAKVLENTIRAWLDLPE